MNTQPHEPRQDGLGPQPANLASAARCGARKRRGLPCQCPAMRNGRCRLHGGLSTGPRTPEGRERSRLAHVKHGLYTQEFKAERAAARLALRAFRRWLDGL